MMPNSPRYTVDDLGAALQFCFHIQDNDSKTIFFIVGIALYSFLVLSVGVMLFFVEPSVWKLIGLLLCWGVLFFVLVPAWGEIVWRSKGKEIVLVGESGISIRHQIWGWGITKFFTRKKISSVFVSRYEYGEAFIDYLNLFKERRFYSLKRGKIAFNYGKNFEGGVNTIRFGAILEKDETKQVVALIHQKFPAYKRANRRIS